MAVRFYQMKLKQGFSWRAIVKIHATLKHVSNCIVSGSFNFNRIACASKDYMSG